MIKPRYEKVYNGVIALVQYWQDPQKVPPPPENVIRDMISALEQEPIDTEAEDLEDEIVMVRGKFMEPSELEKILRHAADLIKEGDSFEGQISYSCMHADTPPGKFEVYGMVRHGNSMGQGGMMLWTRTEDPTNDG